MSTAIYRIGKSGIPVFCDGRDIALDHFRLTESDPRKVILAIALSRARGVAIAYVRKHAPHLLTEMGNLLPPPAKDGQVPNVTGMSDVRPSAEKEQSHGFP